MFGYRTQFLFGLALFFRSVASLDHFIHKKIYRRLEKVKPRRKSLLKLAENCLPWKSISLSFRMFYYKQIPCLCIFNSLNECFLFFKTEFLIWLKNLNIWYFHFLKNYLLNMTVVIWFFIWWKVGWASRCYILENFCQSSLVFW